MHDGSDLQCLLPHCAVRGRRTAHDDAVQATLDVWGATRSNRLGVSSPRMYVIAGFAVTSSIGHERVQASTRRSSMHDRYILIRNCELSTGRLPLVPRFWQRSC